MPANTDRIPPYEYSIDATPSITVVRALADMENSDPLELDLSLYDAIDAEALDTVCRAEEARVRFQVAQYEVCVVDTETVRIWP